MENEMTPAELAIACQTEIYRDLARPLDEPSKFTRDEMQALTELRNSCAEEAGVELIVVVELAGKYLREYEPWVWPGRWRRSLA